MLFNSIHFLFFFPIVTLAYFALPHRARWVWLLICSYYFYMAWNPAYALLMLTATAITYFSGRLITWSNQKEDSIKAEREKKLWVALSFASNLAILFFFKYLDFTLLSGSIVSYRRAYRKSPLVLTLTGYQSISFSVSAK